MEGTSSNNNESSPIVLSSKKQLDVIQLHREGKLDIWISLSCLSKTTKKGVQDFVVNHLYTFSDYVVEFFMPQLCNTSVKDENAASLHKFLMDKCSSLHLALKMFFWFQASVEDDVYPRTFTNHLWHECEMAAVNSKSRSTLRLEHYVSGHTLTDDLPPVAAVQKKQGRHSRSTSMPTVTLESPQFLSQSSLPVIPTVKTVETTQATETTEQSDQKQVKDTNSEGEDNNTPKESFKTSSTSSLTSSSSLEDCTTSDLTSAATLSHPQEDTQSESGKDLSQETVSMAELQFVTKRARQHFFHQQLQFIQFITDISDEIKKRGYSTRAENNQELVKLLKECQKSIIETSVEPNILELAAQGAPLNKGVYLPTCKANGAHYRVLRILPGDSFCLSSRDRVPFMMYVETIDLNVNESDSKDKSKENENQRSSELPPTPDSTEPANGLISAIDKMVSMNREQVIANHHKTEEDEDWVLLQKTEGEVNPVLRMAYPEFWHEKEARIRKSSPYASLPNWKLQSIIVKSGDDLRQEQLAVQLLTTFHSIFVKAELPLWLCPYSVVATSSHGGLIETVPDAISLDALKKRIPNSKTLEDYFISAYGDRTSIRFLQAQRNFVESLAGYSLACYLLQIKDRHNGNILLDKEGHIIHIDYGFMLTSSPGSLGFETAPFKLTDEFIKVMGGDMSDMANYFKLLLIRGFLELRKHYQKIVLLVEMLLPGHKMRCFARRETVIQELVDRFRLSLSDKECVAFIGDLMKESARNWRTGSYDSYQYYLNGIV